MNITDNISNPAKINQQSFFLESHQKLNSNTRPSPAEKNTGCFKDMLQRAKNIELNKVNSVSKTQEIWKSLKIDNIRTSYSRMAEQLFPVQNEENLNFEVAQNYSIYKDISKKEFHNQSINQSNYILIDKIKHIDLII